MGSAVAGGEAEVSVVIVRGPRRAARESDNPIYFNHVSHRENRNDELQRILERVVEIGLRGGWAEFQDSPVQLPRVQLRPRPSSSTPPLSIEREDNVDLPKEEHSISDLPPHDTKIDVMRDGGKGDSDKGKSKHS